MMVELLLDPEFIPLLRWCFRWFLGLLRRRYFDWGLMVNRAFYVGCDAGDRVGILGSS